MDSYIDKRTTSELDEYMMYLSEDVNKAQRALHELREFAMPLNLKLNDENFVEALIVMKLEIKRILNRDTEILLPITQAIIVKKSDSSSHTD
jgi:hypothetical protein